MKRICVINVVGLTPELLPHAPTISSLGKAQPWESPLPAVTLTSQATLMTGLAPKDHGIVGNGWFHKDTGEIRFWQQMHSLIQGNSFVRDYETYSLFWWFPLGAPLKGYVTPRPHYGADGSKIFDIIDSTDCRLVEKLGPFPFAHFWGPFASLKSSQWIAEATACVLKEKKPQLTLCYLPHLDYDFQRERPGNPERVKEVDNCVALIAEAADSIGAEIVIVSEYGLVPVSQPIFINQALRKENYLQVRPSPFGEMLQPYHSQAFAVADHQLAHIYLNGGDVTTVSRLISRLEGVEAVVHPQELGLDHPRAGDLIALAKPNAWFCYYYWLDDIGAPDYARTVDIHRKPGYDPCELLITSKARAALRLLQKRVGLRYLLDVTPLKPELIKGSHGLQNPSEKGPLIIGRNPPGKMIDFKPWLKGQLQ